LEASYQYKPVYFAKVSTDAFQALLPTMEVNSWLTGKRGVSLPFSDSCKLLATDPASAKEVFDAARDFARNSQWRTLEFRGHPPADASASQSFYSHILSLPADADALFSRLDESARRAVRKAEKSGVETSISQSADGMRTFYKLQCQTRRKHGLPPQPFHFFSNLQRHVLAHNLGFIVIARWQGVPIAANLFVHFGTKAIYKYGASDDRYQHLRGSNLAMWRGIQWYARAGFEQIDFGRTDAAHAGLRRFKLGWGAKESTLDYFKFDLKIDCFHVNASKNGLLGTSLFKRIPIPIARMIGNVLYRHVG
jgi:lipid II:glycine glycyltransferase (peptidoglycan interpeptide bridge formation enzyme)